MKKTDLEKDLINILRSLKTNEDVNPSVFFKENTRIRLMNLISEEKPAIKSKHAFVFFRNPALAFRTVGILILILLTLSTGTILAAQSANPKNSLYPVKLTSEEIALKISPSSFKANVAVEIAKRRGDEVASQQKNNSKLEVKYGIEKYKKSIDQARILIPSGNTNLNHELEHEESNLNQLENEYENQNSQEQEVKGASDSGINPSGKNIEQKTDEIKLPEGQHNNLEINKVEIKIGSSPLDTTLSPEHE